MEENQYIVDEIKLKVVRLLKELNSLNTRCKELEAENEQLKNELESQKNTILALEDRNKIIKIAESLAFSKGDVQELRRKVNEYIREIDECIRLLSDR
jgi:hypothetical protein